MSPARSAPRWQDVQRPSRQGLAYSIPFDTTTFVSASIDEVYKTLFEAGFLVLIVILVFLQDWRAMLVPATTVPVTIIGAFAAMAALGFTVNLSTLFAHRAGDRHRRGRRDRRRRGRRAPHREGLSRPRRRDQGDERAVRADHRHHPGADVGVHSGGLLPGLTGQMFAQFALVIAATALISAINAATLKPTQCALWLRPPVPPERRNLFFRGIQCRVPAVRERSTPA